MKENMPSRDVIGRRLGSDLCEAPSFREPFEHVAKAQQTPENALGCGLRVMAKTMDWDYNKGDISEKTQKKSSRNRF
jgi:hypothetical protein